MNIYCITGLFALAPSLLAFGSDDASMPDLGPIKVQVAELRELEFKSEVPAEKQSVEDFSAYVDKELDKTFPPDRRKDMMQGLMRLGMITEEIDLGESFRNAVLTQAGAHYDPTAKKFYYLMTDLPAEAMDVMAAHELVHALQDQHFDLAGSLAALEAEYAKFPRNDDQLLAARGLIEGDATYVMTLWQTNAMGMDLAANAQMEAMVFKQQADMSIDQIIQLSKMQGGALKGEDGEENAMLKAINAMDQIPRYILEPLLAAYMRGAYFAMKLRHEGGWEAVDKAFKDLPRSSEQVLHPEKYNVDRPTRLALPDTLPGDGWTLIDSAVHGELFLDMMLRLHGVPAAAAARATSGWDGDVYSAWRDGEDHVLIALATTWDTETDAREFYTAYRKVLASKYPGVTFPEGAPASDSEGPRTEHYVTGEATGDEAKGAGVLCLRGREVFAVEGGSETRNASILDAVKALPIEPID